MLRRIVTALADGFGFSLGASLGREAFDDAKAAFERTGEANARAHVAIDEREAAKRLRAAERAAKRIEKERHAAQKRAAREVDAELRALKKRVARGE